MNLYDDIAQTVSRQLTEHYSTSFRLAAASFPRRVRRHIYNIYGLVRLADEIVDTYAGAGARKLLDDLEREVHQALRRGYSTNILVQAFMLTARRYDIDATLISPFFASMRMDLPGSAYRRQDYATYIHGSAQVVGLMCLRVFCGGDSAVYQELSNGAMALGAAFQKINFLRDLADDYQRLDRYYFPVGSFERFDEETKQTIIADIKHDLAVARPAIRALSSDVRPAVAAATSIYQALVHKLERTPAAALQKRRVRITNGHKLWLFVRAVMTRGAYA